MTNEEIEIELVKKLKNSFPDMPDFNNCLKELRTFWKKELLNLLKDIEEIKFNWNCGCESCSNIKMKILNYNQENKETK